LNNIPTLLYNTRVLYNISGAHLFRDKPEKLTYIYISSDSIRLSQEAKDKSTFQVIGPPPILDLLHELSFNNKGNKYNNTLDDDIIRITESLNKGTKFKLINEVLKEHYKDGSVEYLNPYIKVLVFGKGSSERGSYTGLAYLVFKSIRDFELGLFMMPMDEVL